ncbi:MAG: SPFH domain-containing protein [Candidatus Micrarchaeota archaeon]
MDRQVTVFVLVIAAAALLVYALIASKLPPVLLVLGLFVIAVVLLFFPRLIELKEYERGVFFRLGKFNKVAGPGWIFMFPAIDSFELVDLRTRTIDVAPQKVVTQDNIAIEVDAIVYMRVVDPKKVVIAVKDVQGALTHLLHANIRSVIGKMTLDEVIRKTEEINAALYSTVKDVEKDWGIFTQNIEIQSIELPQGLIAAMQKRKEAGEYKAKLETEAQAREISLDIINRAASKLSDRTMTLLYVDALKIIANGKSNKIIFPLELSRMAAHLADQTGGQFEDTAQSLVKAYMEQQRQKLDEKKV